MGYLSSISFKIFYFQLCNLKSYNNCNKRLTNISILKLSFHNLKERVDYILQTSRVPCYTIETKSIIIYKLEKRGIQPVKEAPVE